jgi:hypothetical protein
MIIPASGVGVGSKTEPSASRTRCGDAVGTGGDAKRGVGAVGNGNGDVAEAAPRLLSLRWLRREWCDPVAVRVGITLDVIGASLCCVRARRAWVGDGGDCGDAWLLAADDAFISRRLETTHDSSERSDG